MQMKWQGDPIIKVKIERDCALISANRDGLLSLAKQLNELANQKKGTHIHYDQYNSLEEGSDELIVEIIETEE
ncbi:MAG: hypothetical protein IJF87_01580 [Erysipelotrichaceae bacterium]|nr:hypothetical protein [Erysipelotrichaceae bacterium]